MTRRSWMLMAATAALWGASYLFIKVALRDVSPPFLVCARTALGGLVLAAIAYRQGAFSSLRGHMGTIFTLAVVQIVGPFLLLTFGEERLASSITGILVSAAPIFVVLFTLFMDTDDRLNTWGLGGMLIGMLGIVVLFGVDLSDSTRAVVGGAMVLLATVGYAIGAIIVRTRLQGVKPVGIVAATMSISALITLPWALATLPTSMSANAVGSLVALGIGGTGFAFLFFYTLIAEVGAAKASIVAYVAPVFSVFYGALLLSESITVSTIAGLVMILIGSWIGAEGRPPWRRAAANVPPTALAVEELADVPPVLSRT